MLTSFINILGWTLIHSIWQAAVIFLVLQCLLKYLKHSPAKMRYALSSLALAGIFICFLFTFYYQWENNYIINTTTMAGPAAATANDEAGMLHFSGSSLTGALSGGWLTYMVGLYTVGLLFFLGKVIRDLYIMQKIRHTRITHFDTAWEKYLDRLAGAWNIPRKVGLYLSEKIDVPVVIGYFKPVIYLPFSIANNLTPEQIEVILLHELAHIKRYDFLANILQTIVETILFFNPFVWWLSKNISKEREIACDELVIAEKEPKIYAESLLALEENRLNKGKFILAATNKRQQLFQRIKNIMEQKTKKLNVAQKLLVLLLIAIATFSVSWLIPEKNSVHQETKKATLNKAEHSPVTSADTVAPPVQDTAVPPPSTLRIPAPPTPDRPPLPDTTKHIMRPPNPPEPPSPALDSASMNTFTGVFDSIRQDIFNSDAWKKYRQQMKEYTSKLIEYFQNKDNYTHQLQQYFNSEDWKQQKKEIRNQAQKLQQELKHNNWSLNADSLRDAMTNNMPNLDSILSLTRMKVAQAMHSIGHSSPYTLTYSNGNSKNQVQVSQFIDRLRNDGLLKTNNNYKIRFDDRGLFINGKKLPDNYYKKYRSIIGDNTKIKIKKDKNSYSSSFSTAD